MATSADDLSDGTARENAKKYATLAYVSSAFLAAMEGSAVESDDLNKVLQALKDGDERSFIKVQKTGQTIDLLYILQELILQKSATLTIPIDPKPRIMVVEVEGKVFEATINDNPNAKDKFQVTLSSCSLNTNGELVKKPFTKQPITVGVVTEDKKEVVVAEGFGQTVKQGVLINRPHQADALLATVGVKYDAKTGDFVNDESLISKKDHLIVAGTGTGKSGILIAKTITSPQGGIMTVPDTLMVGMENDTKDFIGKDANILVVKSEADFAKIEDALKEVPPRVVIMGHSLLKAYLATDLPGKGISLSIDEAHEVDPDVMSKLKESKNHITAVTGTPTLELLNLFDKKPSFDMPLYYAQMTLGTVRPVLTSDSEVDSENPKALARAALMQHLGRSADVQAARSKGNYKRQAKPLTLYSSSVQGMVCTGEDDMAKAVYALLSTANESKPARTNYINPAMLSRLAKFVRPSKLAKLKQQMHDARRAIVENEMKIDIILAIQAITQEGTLNRDKLQAKLRGGDNIDVEYNGAMNKVNSVNLDQIIVQIDRLSIKEPWLKDYAAHVVDYLKAGHNKDANAQKTALDNMEKAYKEVAVLLCKDSSDEDIKRAESLYKRGLFMQIITSGPFKTGFSVKNTLNTTYIQATARKEGDTADVMQSLGRPIRAPDVCAFVNLVVKASIPSHLRCMKSADVFSESATAIYAEQLEKEKRPHVAENVQKADQAGQVIKKSGGRFGLYQVGVQIRSRLSSMMGKEPGDKSDQKLSHDVTDETAKTPEKRRRL